MTGSPPLVLPQISINGTHKIELVEQQLAVLGALRNVLTMMSAAAPNARDYQRDPKQFELAREAWVDRQAKIVWLRREIEKHAEAIDAL